MNARVWHYTVGNHIQSILSDRMLKPATARVPEGERPVVWFSVNQVWELTANKGWQNNDGTIRTLSKEETAQYANGLYRIEVAPETAPLTVYEFRKRSGISSRVWKGLLHAAEEVGASPAEWRVSFDPVPAELCLRIERWEVGVWQQVDMNAK